MPNLIQVKITFNTHNDNKDGDTILHAFVKNRSNTSSTPEQATDFISNLLAYQSHEATSPWDINPYLAFAESLAQGTSFADDDFKVINPQEKRPDLQLSVLATLALVRSFPSAHTSTVLTLEKPSWIQYSACIFSSNSRFAHFFGHKMNCFPLCERKTSRSREHERTVSFINVLFNAFRNAL